MLDSKRNVAGSFAKAGVDWETSETVIVPAPAAGAGTDAVAFAEPLAATIGAAATACDGIGVALATGLKRTGGGATKDAGGCGTVPAREACASGDTRIALAEPRLVTVEVIVNGAMAGLSAAVEFEVAWAAVEFEVA